MMISTRGRYALRVMLELAQKQGSYTPLKDIAQDQGISLKYLERILPVLTKNGFIEGIQGKGGGYRLTRTPTEYKIGDILRLTEGDLAPVSCMECGAEPCSKRSTCPTYPMWEGFHKLTNNYFDGITLQDLLQQELP